METANNACVSGTCFKSAPGQIGELEVKEENLTDSLTCSFSSIPGTPFLEQVQSPPTLIPGRKYFLEWSLGSPGPLPLKHHSIRGSHLHWTETTWPDWLSCLHENSEQWTQQKNRGRCTSKAGEALDGDVHSCCRWLPTTPSSFT